MFGKTASVTVALVLFLLCAPAASHGLEDKSQALPPKPQVETPEVRIEQVRSQDNVKENQNLFLTTSADSAKEQKTTNSFLQDQLEQKSPVYLWVPGRGAVGVGVTMSW